MASIFVATLLFRWFLTLSLLAASILRINGFSALYFGFFLVMPFLPNPSHQSFFKGPIRKYLLSICALSLGLCVAHIIFQIVLAANPPYGSIIIDCFWQERLARQIGFNKLGHNVWNDIRLLAPDAIIFIISVVTFLYCRKLANKQVDQIMYGSDDDRRHVYDKLDSLATLTYSKYGHSLKNINSFFSIVLLWLTGIVQPSVLSAVYFITLLVIATIWSFSKAKPNSREQLLARSHTTRNRSTLFSKLRNILMVYCVLHLIVLYLYQMQFFQDAVEPKSFIARILGLTGYFKTNCSSPSLPILRHGIPWYSYVCPGLIILTFWTFATHYSFSLKWNSYGKFPNLATHMYFLMWWTSKKRSETKQRSPSTQLQTENPLQVNVDAHQTSTLNQDVTSQNTVATNNDQRIEAENNVLLEPVPTAVETDENLHIHNIILQYSQQKFYAFLQYVEMNIHLLALIAMLTWSISYHSWPAFVLLIFACLFFIHPRTYEVMMTTAPLLVIYGEIMIIATYIYGLNLHKELPEVVNGFNLQQVGLQRFSNQCLHLGLQSIFLAIFWLTLRHKQNRARNSERELYRVIGITIQTLLAQYWILACLGALLIVSLHGQPTIYQIIYMFFFLLLTVTYKLSWPVFRFILKPFWIILIMYSLLVLVLLYTFQFDVIPELWRNATHLSNDWLADIGLKQYKSRLALFGNLLPPTLCIVTAVIQNSYLHRLFLIYSSLKGSRHFGELQRKYGYPTNNIENQEPTVGEISVGEPFREVNQNGLDSNPHETQSLNEETNQNLDERIERFLHEMPSKLTQLYNFLWLLAETHIVKAVMLTIFIVCVAEVTALNGIFAIFVILQLPYQRLQKVLSYIMTLLIAVSLLSKLTFQLSVIDTKNLRSNCSYAIPEWNGTMFITFYLNRTLNDIEWFGLKKVSNVSSYVGGYIAIICLITMEKVINHRQRQMYELTNTRRPPSGILFPNIDETKIDTSLKSRIKYVIDNFCSLWGIELCIFTEIIVIGARGDVYSAIYSVVLGLQLFLPRKQLSTLWPIYIAFLTISIIAQYLLLLGLPTYLCYVYPWTGYLNINLLQWLYLPQIRYKLNPFLLIGDFFMLMFACCQMKAYLSGKRDSHLTVRIHAEDGKMTNPGNFLNNRCWLDTIQIFIFQYFLWITYAVIFIVGTSQINIFCFGFLLADFFFLWHGQSIVKRLKFDDNGKTVKTWWKLFIAYTYTVILLKTSFQVVVCAWPNIIPCIVSRIFNVVCLRAFVGEDPVERMNCVTLPKKYGVGIDGVCLMFLLIQQLIFNSNQIYYVAEELFETNQLSKKVAKFLRDCRQERIKLEIESREKIRKRIKDSVEVLKSRRNSKLFANLSHEQIIAAGDYYLFRDLYQKEKLVGQTVDTQYTDTVSDDRSTQDKSQIDDLDPSSKEKIQNKQQIANEHHEDVQSSEAASNDLVYLKQDTDFECHDVSQRAEPGITDNPLYGRHSSIYVSKSQTGGPASTQYRIADGESSSSTLQEHTKHSHNQFIESASNAASTDTKRAFKTQENISDLPAPQNSLFLNKQLNVQEVTLKDITTDSQPSRLDSLDGKVTSKEEKKKGAFRRFINYLYCNIWITYTDKLTRWLDTFGIEYRAAAKKIRQERANLSKVHSNERAASTNDVHDSAENTVVAAAVITANADLDLDEPLESKELQRLQSSLAYKTESNDGWQGNMSRFDHFIFALYYSLCANTDNICYFLILLNLIVHGTVLSLILPLSTFLWAFLSIPRPHRYFWIFAFTYTEIVVLIKYTFQFSFWTFNRPDGNNDPFWAPRIIGIVQEDNFGRIVAFDLILLLSLFFHCAILKSFGLWNDDDSNNDHDEMTESEEIWPNIKFIQQLLRHDSKPGTIDVYTSMFACTFIAFLIIIFGWSSFGENASQNDNLSTFIAENNIPLPFLIAMLTQFLLMLCDRAIYLRRSLLARLIVYIIQVIALHTWLFFFLPFLTRRSFKYNAAAIILYITYCIYFRLSCFQLCQGYPIRVLRRFLTDIFNNYTYYFVLCVNAIPFFLEFRTLMDWTCTDTTLTLWHWLKMEDIFYNIFYTKCRRDYENSYPQKKGDPKSPLFKVALGGFLIFLLGAIIWFPLLFMSLAKTSGIADLPTEGQFSLSIVGYEPLYSYTAEQRSITMLSQSDYNHLFNVHKYNNPSARSFLSQYDRENVVRVLLNENSSPIWEISPPVRQKLINDLSSNQTITLRFSWSFNRKPNSALVSDMVTGNNYFNLYDPNLRDGLSQMLMFNDNQTSMVTIPKLYPSFVLVPATGASTVVKALDNGSYVDCGVELLKGPTYDDVLKSMVEWWRIVQKSPFHINNTKSSRSNSLEMIVFSDKVIPPGLSFLAGYGIIGLYVSLVLVVGRFIRIFVSSVSYRIMFDEIPDPNAIHELCEEIYMVRESHEFELEEELFAKLIFLYRSPETIIRLTRLAVNKQKVE
ncbi:Piezo-type mechanosensitive ion channel component 1 [Trichoplax sp. H2]|nr:Piezo-type mechanosensitive ion channel component 1 [Trichoplax sp. H2]|eukprot:RDD46920.1 Piezo-type mechanosensitive ion channel component 1 [Trichoplax sp. H2]